MTIYTKAYDFAVIAHTGQKRKYTGEPYVRHIDSVLKTLEIWGITDEIILAAAALHDVVEDTGFNLADIRKEFGDEIAELVWWLTDYPLPDNRDTRMLASAWRLSRAPWQAKVIKGADIADNTADIMKYDPKFAAVYIPEKARLLDMMIQTPNVERDLRILILLDQVRDGVCRI